MKTISMTAVAGLVATPAFADVCDKVNPSWTGEAVSAIDQLIFMVSGPYMVVPFILLGLAILSPWYRLKAGLGVAFIALAGLYTYDWFWPLSDIAGPARSEGCEGNPVLYIGLLALMGLLVIWRSFAQRAAS